MWLRLRQICVVAEDLRQVGQEIGNILGIEPCFTDPAVGPYGLKNTLWPVGHQFLEVVTPIEAGTAGGRYIERRGGDGGYMVITQTDDVDHFKTRVDELGVRIANPIVHEATGHDGIQLHPADTGGSFFEIDQIRAEGGDEVGGPWPPAGPNWQPYTRTDVVSAITGAELQSPEPDALAQRWSSIAEIELTEDGDGNPVMRLDDADVRFVEATDGRGEGLGAIEVRAENPGAIIDAAKAHDRYVRDDQVTVAGLRVNLR